MDPQPQPGVSSSMPASPARNSLRQRFILRITSCYIVFAFASIFFADELLSSFTTIPQLAWVSMGAAFVVITSILLFFALGAVPSDAELHTRPYFETIALSQPGSRRQKMLTYLLAAVLTLLMLTTRASLMTQFGERPMLILFMLPVIVSALVGGWGPGVFATAIAALGSNWYTIPPHGSFSIANPIDLLLWLFLIGCGLLISLLSEVMRRALAKSESSLRLLDSVVSGTSDAIYVKDRQGRFLLFNESAARITGVSAAKTLGNDDFTLFPEEVAKELRAMDERIMASGERLTFEENITTLTGERLVILATKGPIYDGQGRAAGVFGISRDITQRKRNEERLRLAATVFETTREGVMVTDAQRRILLVNRAFCEISGYTEAEILGQTPALFKSGRQNAAFYKQLWVSIDNTGYWQGELWDRRKNGEVNPIFLSITALKDASGKIVNYVGVSSDISRIKNSEAQLEHMAYHDDLTQLPNRLLFHSRLEHNIQAAQRTQGMFALLMLDLDLFKDVNDSYGHGAGDELLQLIASRLTTRLRGTDTVARLGGDEFAVLTDSITHPEDAARLANEIIAILSAPWHLSGNVEVHVGVSIGIGIYPDHGKDPNELLQHADVALFQAKAKGRGNFQYFSEALTNDARMRIEIDARLRRAIEHHELRVYYQPQVDIATGRIVGAEALVRWLDPVQGLIPPSRFIPVAESSSLINAIGEFVLFETCRQGRRWIDAGLPPLTLAVNLSPHQFLHGDIETLVARALAETQFPAGQLELELTESALMENNESSTELLNRIRMFGVRFAIDDFGTGYSSLAYLKSFPLDVLKIDKRFVDDIPHHKDDMEIAATIVAMGHILGFKVLAEGVEQVEQLEFLQQQGCDMYQGYLTSPPLPADDFETLYRKHLISAVIQ